MGLWKLNLLPLICTTWPAGAMWPGASETLVLSKRGVSDPYQVGRSCLPFGEHKNGHKRKLRRSRCLIMFSFFHSRGVQYSILCGAIYSGKHEVHWCAKQSRRFRGVCLCFVSSWHCIFGAIGTESDKCNDKRWAEQGFRGVSLFFLDIAVLVQLTGKAVMIVVGGFEVSASLLVPTTSTPQSSNKPQTTHTCHVKLLPVNIRSPACFLNHFHSSEVTLVLLW